MVGDAGRVGPGLLSPGQDVADKAEMSEEDFTGVWGADARVCAAMVFNRGRHSYGLRLTAIVCVSDDQSPDRIPCRLGLLPMAQ